MFEGLFGKSKEAPKVENDENENENETGESGIEVNDSPVEEVVLEGDSKLPAENQPTQEGTPINIIDGPGSERNVETTPVGEVNGEELTLDDASVNDGDPYNSADKAA